MTNFNLATLTYENLSALLPLSVLNNKALTFQNNKIKNIDHEFMRYPEQLRKVRRIELLGQSFRNYLWTKGINRAFGFAEEFRNIAV